MGAVYLGEHTLIGRRAAIKVLHRDRSSQRESIERFFTEAKATSAVEEPGIVQIYDFGVTSNGTAYLVMEFLDGESLSARLRRLRLLAPTDAVRITRQLAGSLAAAHAHGIVHRDLKPENLMMVRDGEASGGERPKILDFGIAKLGDDARERFKTRTGAVMGTPAYMSPEQCNDTGKIDHRTDVYSLGCVLFHLLTGRPPFDVEGVGATISAHLTVPAPRPSDVARHIPTAIDPLVARCLAKRPEDRFSTMVELQEACDAVLAQLPVEEAATVPYSHPSIVVREDSPTTLRSSVGESALDARPRRVGAWMIISAAALVAGVVLAVMTTTRDAPEGSESTTIAPASVPSPVRPTHSARSSPVHRQHRPLRPRRFRPRRRTRHRRSSRSWTPSRSSRPPSRPNRRRRRPRDVARACRRRQSRPAACMTNGTRALVLITALVMISSGSARAEDAESLFREGKDLLEAGKLEEACEKLEASERMKAHNATELSLADCWERVGRTASAWEMFVKLAGSAKREDRALEARKRAKALEDKLVHLTIEIDDADEVEDLVITRNDQVIDRAQWNQEVPVDPGEYTITARADKHEEWSTTFKVKTKNKTIIVPKLERAAPTKRMQMIPTPNPNRSLAIGLVVGGTGAIAIATGFAVHSKGLQDESNAICPAIRCGDVRGVDLNQRARSEGWIANIGWGLGGAAIVASIVAWTMGARSSDRALSVTPMVTDDRAGLAVGGSF